MITASELNDRFIYNPKTGELSWRPRKYSKGYSGVRPGKKAGWMSPQGYCKITINTKQYFLHRIVWMMVYGKFPDRLLDHIDGDKTNNRLSNLREADFSQNCANRKIQSNNVTGLKGVSLNHGRWVAKIAFRGKRYHIGSFPTREEAYKAYLDRAHQLHGQFARAA